MIKFLLHVFYLLYFLHDVAKISLVSVNQGNSLIQLGSQLLHRVCRLAIGVLGLGQSLLDLSRFVRGFGMDEGSAGPT